MVTIIGVTIAALGAISGLDLPSGAGAHGVDFWTTAVLSGSFLGASATAANLARVPEQRSKGGEISGWESRTVLLRRRTLRAQAAAAALRDVDLKGPVGIRRAVLELLQARTLTYRYWVRLKERRVEAATYGLYLGLVWLAVAAGVYAGI